MHTRLFHLNFSVRQTTMFRMHNSRRQQPEQVEGPSPRYTGAEVERSGEEELRLLGHRWGEDAHSLPLG